jgi:hypothetical protein
MLESTLLLIMGPALFIIIFWTIQNDKPNARHQTKGLLALKDAMAEPDAEAEEDKGRQVDAAKP